MPKYSGSNRHSLSPDFNLNITDNRNDPAVEAALNLMYNNYSEKTERDSNNRKIQKLFKEGFQVKEPTGTRKIGSKKMYQALWRTASRMRPLDFAIHGTARPEWAEKIVTDGVGTVMDRGGYASSLRDKNGGFMKLLMYGDAFIQVGTGTSKKDAPVKYRPISNTNVYFDAYATAMRSPNNSSSVTKCVVVFSHPWDEAVKLYPKLKKIGGTGRLPRLNSDLKELERNYEQETELDDIIEIGYFYDISNKNYTVFAGTSCTILEQFKGDQYPFMMKDEAYIPILHYSCMPSAEGFYNHGLGAMVYDLAIMSRRLMNMEVGHVEKNVDPDTLIITPQGKASEFFQKAKLAGEMRAAGKRAYIAMEQDPNNPNSNSIQAQTLLTQNLTNEFQLVYDLLDRELKRMGIFLDEADRSGNTTATQVMAEEESSNSFVKQIMEYNASESKFAVELTMDVLETTISKNNKDSLNLTTEIPIGGGETMRADGVTMGMVKDELSKHHYFVKVNARTGAIPSNILQQVQVSRMLGATQPNTPAYFKLMGQMAGLNDRDIKVEEFMMAAPEAPTGPAGEIPEGAAPSGTDRLAIDVRKQMDTAVL